MRVTVTLNERDPQAMALLRHLKSVARSRSSSSPFPFNLLEWLIRALLSGLERLVTLCVDTVAADLKQLWRALFG